jgi:salicylate hydroxylase
VLQHLGLGEAIERLGFSPGKQWTQNWQTGEVILEFERGPELRSRYGAPYLHIHRADLHQLLVDALREVQPEAIQLGHRLVEVEADGTLRFAHGHEAGADLVAGADGLHSVVRRQLFGDVKPAFTGQVAWRGIVPAERLPDGVRGMTPGIHVGPGRLFMRYPVRDGALLNYAAFVELEGWEEESWSIPSTTEELLGHFEGWHELVRGIIAATPESQIYKWALHTREPLPSWIAGRVTLLGDAAHAMLPFMGQGAATAIEDGMVLARCLSKWPREEALRRYEAARLDRTTMVQTQSRLLGLKFQGKDPDALGRGPIQNEETLGLFAYDAVTVPL